MSSGTVLPRISTAHPPQMDLPAASGRKGGKRLVQVRSAKMKVKGILHHTTIHDASKLRTFVKDTAQGNEMTTVLVRDPASFVLQFKTTAHESTKVLFLAACRATHLAAATK